MNPDLDRLYPYPFERLERLRAGAGPPADVAFISMAIGEPRHDAPPFVVERLRAAAADLGRYPQSAGLDELRAACAGWLQRRFDLPAAAVDPHTRILPVAGTREGLFAFAQAVVDRSRTNAAVLVPNPGYQIYAGAALLAGAEPVYLDTTAAGGYVPDFDAVTADAWERCQLLYVCTPGNPTGAVLDSAVLQRLVELADRHDFVIAADECYTEIYRDEAAPPPSLLQACVATGRDDLRNCVAFHSLSKRSSVPGLRSGFVAGDPRVLARFRQYRSYHGCAMPVHHQLASVSAWNDDAHVVANRRLYREKFAAAGRRIAAALDCALPPAAFYLWAPVPGDDEEFAARLYREHNVLVLPGRYLARDHAGGNPGRGHVRLSLVADAATCDAAAERIERFVGNL